MTEQRDPADARLRRATARWLHSLRRVRDELTRMEADVRRLADTVRAMEKEPVVR